MSDARIRSFRLFVSESIDPVRSIERASPIMEEKSTDEMIEVLKRSLEMGIISKPEFMEHGGRLMGLFLTDEDVKERDPEIYDEINEDVRSQLKDQVTGTWQIRSDLAAKFEPMWESARWRVFKDGSCEVVVDEDPETTALVYMLAGVTAGDFDYSLSSGPLDFDGPLHRRIIQLFSKGQRSAQELPQ